MARSRLLAVAVCGAAALFVCGIVLGRLSSPRAKRGPRVAGPSVNAPEPVVQETNRATSSKSGAAEQDPLRQSGTSQSSVDFVSNLKRLLDAGHTRKMYSRLSTLMDSLDLTNVKDVLDFAQKLPRPQDRMMVMQSVVSRWAELNPRDALAFAETIPTMRERSSAIQGAVSGWAETDAPSAVAYVQQMPAGPNRD